MSNIAAFAEFATIMAARPVILAPMEDVSDPAFRTICRDLGADLCFTEFVNVDGLVRGDRRALRKITRPMTRRWRSRSTVPIRRLW